MAIEGKGPYESARILAMEKVERPSHYLAQRGLGKHKTSHNTDLKNRLTDYAGRSPDLCKQTDEDEEQGCKSFEIVKGRFSIRLTAPYSEERRRAASEAAKAQSSNLTRKVQKPVL